MMRQALIVEDRADTREWLTGILCRALPGISVRTAADLRTARRLLAAQAWRLVLVDLGLPDGSGIELLHDIRQQCPGTDAIVTTIYDDDDNLFGAITAGACGYLLKSQPADMLVQQLQQFEAGVPPLSPSIARRMLTWFRDHTPAPTAAGPAPDIQLTPRDADVLACIGRGLRVAETAQYLGLTENTVASYIKQIYRKLGISGRAEAALEAARRGLV